MFLTSTHKGAGKFIDSFNDIEPAIDKGRLEEIMQKLFANKDSLNELKEYIDFKHELIKGHLKLGTFIATHYARIFPTMSDDLQSEAFLAICIAVDRIHNIHHTYYTRYITKYIQGCLFAFINKQTKTVYVPKEKIFDMLAAGEDLSRYTELTNIDDIKIEDKKRTEEHLVDTFERLIKKSDMGCLEHQIMLFHIAGYADREIAKTFNYTTQRIQQIRMNTMKKLRSAYELDLIVK